MKHTLTLFTALLLVLPHAIAAPAPCGETSEPITLLTYRDAEWYGSTFWTGPDWTRVGKDWHHPGESTPSVRRFTAPRDGRVTVTGRVFKLHLSGDGIRASIRHNDREVWKAEIDGDDDKGVEPQLALDVKKGDALRFVVHKRGGIGCDTTGWDPVVMYSDGQRFQASASFAAKKQGEGGWFYEMLGKGEVPQPDKPPVPAPAELKEELARLAPSLAPQTDRELLLLALEEWWREDKLTDTAQAYKAAIKEHAERTQKLAAEFGDGLKPELQRAAANAPAVGVQASACSDLAQLRSALRPDAPAQTRDHPQQPAAELRQAAVVQACAAQLEPPGRAVFRLVSAARRRLVRAGETGAFARRPRHRRQPIARRQLSRTAPFLRWQADRVLLRDVPAAAARPARDAGERTGG